MEIEVSSPIVGFRETLTWVCAGEDFSSQQTSKNKSKSSQSKLAICANEVIEICDNSNDGDTADGEGEMKMVKVYLPPSVEGTVPSKVVTLAIRAIPLPTAITALLDKHPDEVKALVEATQSGSHSKENENENENSFLSRLKRKWNRSGERWRRWWQEGRIMCFGPRDIGPNALVNNTNDVRTHSIVEAGKRKDEQQTENNTTTLLDSASIGINQNTNQSLFEGIQNSVKSGFQLATAAGPMCREPMYGVCFMLEKVIFNEEKEEEGEEGEGEGEELAINTELAAMSISEPAAHSPNFGPLSGQLISLTKSLCWKAFDNKGLPGMMRLVEALFLCSLQCSSDQLGKLYACLSQRRATVVDESIWEGTVIFVIEAYLPVIESFGLAGLSCLAVCCSFLFFFFFLSKSFLPFCSFSVAVSVDDLRKRTSGSASNPQLVFSHWQMIDIDPFFKVSGLMLFVVLLPLFCTFIFLLSHFLSSRPPTRRSRNSATSCFPGSKRTSPRNTSTRYASGRVS